MKPEDKDGDAMGCVGLTVLFVLILVGSIILSGYQYLKSVLPLFF